MRTVQCSKLGRELPGLDHPPLRGELGARIYNEISEEAWKLWLQRSTMIINEFRLNPSTPEGQEIMHKHMEDFFFGEETPLPPDFVPQAE